MYSALITLKALIDNVTEADCEFIQNAEKGLHDLHFKDCDFNISKVVTKIRTIIKNLEANVLLSNTLVLDTLTALYDNDCSEDYQLDIKLFKTIRIGIDLLS